MQYFAASVVVVSGTALWVVGATLEHQVYLSQAGNRGPAEFAEWGGAIMVGLGIALIARMAGISIRSSTIHLHKQD